MTRATEELHGVGSGEATNAEEITQCSAVEEEPAYGRFEATQYA